MAVMHKGNSPATLEANRANSLKSTGPNTERGQQASRRNALKHWQRADIIRPSLAALDEDPEEFARTRDSLYRALAPRDEFEEIIMDDMADVRWRWRAPGHGTSRPRTGPPSR